MRRSIVLFLCSFLVASPCVAEPLEILVYGATGKIGSQAVGRDVVIVSVRGDMGRSKTPESAAHLRQRF